MSANPTFAALGAVRPRRFALDQTLVLAVVALLLLGLVAMTSASIGIAAASERLDHESLYFFWRQGRFVLLGLVGAGVMMRVPSAVWERLAFPLLVAAFVLLIIVLIPGIGVVEGGARRWLKFGGFGFQASELARVFLLIYVASYVVRRQEELTQELPGFIKPLAVLFAAVGLLLLEPDYGAAAILLATGLGVLFLAGVRLRYYSAIAALIGVAMAFIAVAAPYRWLRIKAVLTDPFESGGDSTFQLRQALIAIGRGEVFGVGLGSSVQKLFYLPQAHTDFVFSVLAEELGLIGVAVTFALYIFIVSRAFGISRLAAEAGLAFQAYCAAAFGIWLGLQAFINIAVNMGVFPTKGLTLPLMSYGGTSLLVTMIWLGLVLRIHHEAASSGRSAVARGDYA
jgi:cell division protein FtsW